MTANNSGGLHVRLAVGDRRLPGQMARDGSLWRDTYVTGLETLLGFWSAI